MRVIGAGLPRTGTLTQKEALERSASALLPLGQPDRRPRAVALAPGGRRGERFG